MRTRRTKDEKKRLGDYLLRRTKDEKKRLGAYLLRRSSAAGG
jgi:hypothetical protein